MGTIQGNMNFRYEVQNEEIRTPPSTDIADKIRKSQSRWGQYEGIMRYDGMTKLYALTISQNRKRYRKTWK
jgi:hypothetical protein